MNQIKNSPLSEIFNFWKWLYKEGLRQFLDRWLVFHLIIGYIAQFALKLPLHEIAIKVFIPFAAVLIALVFAWSGSISSLLQANEMDEIRKTNGLTPFRNYVFNFQLVTLINFIIIIMWSLLGLDPFKGVVVNSSCYSFGKTIVFAVSSLAIRECWTMILRLQLHLLQIALIRDEKRKKMKRITSMLYIIKRMKSTNR